MLSSLAQLSDAVLALDISGIVELLKGLPSAYSEYWWSLYDESPRHVVVETCLIVYIVYILLFKKSYDPKAQNTKLSNKEIDELVREWTPDPLTKPLTAEQKEDAKLTTTIESIDGVYVKVVGVETPLLNVSAFDFLGIGSRPETHAIMRQTLEKYGCGSCGPRGFYGTIDTHYQMEEQLAEWMGHPESICYSDAGSALSSVLPAFAKRGDLLVADEGVNADLRTGLRLSRGEIRYYKHGDMDDLERVLRTVQEEDRKLGRAPESRRRFLVTEAVFRNFGDITDLRRLVALKRRFCYRLVLDESFSFGTMGPTGRGLAEAAGVEHGAVDILVASLGNSMASVGGFCVAADRECVDHQRLSGAGYCFSASAPPFTQRAVSAGLELIKNEPALLGELSEASASLRRAVQAVPGIKVLSDAPSPLLHVVLWPGNRRRGASTPLTTAERRRLLQAVVARARDLGVLFVLSRHIPDMPVCAQPPPSIRLAASAAFTAKQLALVGKVLAEATGEVLAEEGVEVVEEEVVAVEGGDGGVTTPARANKKRKNGKGKGKATPGTPDTTAAAGGGGGDKATPGATRRSTRKRTPSAKKA